jgi:potassium-transporting ATPase KdpC subunit
MSRNDPTKTVPAQYNAQNSSGSNLGPTSKASIERVKGDAEKLKADNNKPVPVDLVTTSGSGLDPDITPAAAAFPNSSCRQGAQRAGIGRRGARRTTHQGQTRGVFGEPRVNVLELNLALDQHVSR